MADSLLVTTLIGPEPDHPRVLTIGRAEEHIAAGDIVTILVDRKGRTFLRRTTAADLDALAAFERGEGMPS